MKTLVSDDESWPRPGQSCVSGNPGWFWIYTTFGTYAEPVIDTGIHITFSEVAHDNGDTNPSVQ